MTVHIVCTVLDGERYLAPFIESVCAQTHAQWRLWVRDDGSRDASGDIVRAFAAQDARVQPLPADGRRLGVAAAFGWLLDQLPANAEHVMFADADDVWLPEKITLLRAAMVEAEQRASGPVLVHSDLVVVDSALNEIDRSFWHFNGITPGAVALRHLVVRNVVTGAATMINRALRERTGAIPAAAVVHDWWIACVASAFGRIVAVPTPTVLYRQHGANVTGARRPSSTWALRHVVARAPGALRNAERMRAGITAAAAQARAFLDRYGDQLPADDRAFLGAYALLPERRFLRRKLELARLQLLPENGWVQNAGILLRA